MTEFPMVRHVSDFTDDEMRPPPPQHGQRWGNWEYDAIPDEWEPSLVHRGEGRGYDVVLARVSDEHEFADWLAHLSGKAWITSADLGDFVRGVDATIGIRRLGR